MKTLILTLLISSTVYAKDTYWKFVYKKGDFSVTVTEDSENLAFRKAARECFKYLSKGVYPGEAKGLEFIDICANPEEIIRLD